MARRTSEELSELECTALGVVAKFGPLSPYAVRQHFVASPASHFSASTGSIYPLLRRLEEAQWIESRAAARGRQARREVSITRAGRIALRAWLARAPSRADLDPPADPVRTRLYFLPLLTRRQQERFFAQTLAGFEERLRAYEAAFERYDAEGPQAASRHATRGGILTMRARILWLKEVRDAMSAGP